MRVLVLWAVGRRCSVPQVFAKPGKSREIRERAGYYVRHLGVANAVFFCACSTKSWKTRDLLRSCLREAAGADLLQCKGKEPDQFAKWFCTILRCKVRPFPCGSGGRTGWGRSGLRWLSQTPPTLTLPRCRRGGKRKAFSCYAPLVAGNDCFDGHSSVPSPAKRGKDRMGARPHQWLQAISPLPDRCIQPIPTRKNGAAPDSPPASCVLRGRRVRSPW